MPLDWDRTQWNQSLRSGTMIEGILCVSDGTGEASFKRDAHERYEVTDARG